MLLSVCDRAVCPASDGDQARRRSQVPLDAAGRVHSRGDAIRCWPDGHFQSSLHWTGWSSFFSLLLFG